MEKTTMNVQELASQITSKDVFMRVQSEIARRANLNPDGKRRVYSSRYALSGMVYCGHCGDIYRRVKWNNWGCKSTVWRCVSRVLKKDVDFDCPARTVKEEVLQGVIVTAVNDAYARKNIVTALLKQNIESTVFGDLEERLAAVDEKLAALQTHMIAVSGDEAAVDALCPSRRTPERPRRGRRTQRPSGAHERHDFLLR